MTDTDTLWGEVKSEISRQIKKPAFETWFAPSSGKVTEDCTFIVEAPNEFAKEWSMRKIVLGGNYTKS